MGGGSNCRTCVFLIDLKNPLVYLFSIASHLKRYKIMELIIEDRKIYVQERTKSILFQVLIVLLTNKIAIITLFEQYFSFSEQNLSKTTQ